MPGCVYFADTVDGRFTKIGYSTNLKTRLVSLRTSSALKLSLRGSIPGTRAAEMALHSQFSKCRAKGEWFRRTPELDATITDLLQTGNAESITIPDPPDSEPGRLSDLAASGQRNDWSLTRSKLKALEPGDVVVFTCLPGFSVSAFRSTILTIGRRLSFEDGWTLSTRTKGRKLHCFLAPS